MTLRLTNLRNRILTSLRTSFHSINPVFALGLSWLLLPGLPTGLPVGLPGVLLPGLLAA